LARARILGNLTVKGGHQTGFKRLIETDAMIQVQGEAQSGKLQIWLVRGMLASILLMAGLVGISAVNQPSKIDGVIIFNHQPRGHDDSLHLATGNLPPVGGPHHSQPQDCGIYLTPVEPERAIHSLEHGAVWITYQPELSETDIADMEDIVRDQEYLLLSPFPGQRSPIVLTAWGVQLEVSTVHDARIEQFIARYLLGPATPERGASC
jgi:hypothetical protein